MATKTKKKDKKLALSGTELQLAARYFTVSNLGGDDRKMVDAKTIDREFFYTQQGHESEGLSIDPEYKMWLKEFSSGDVYYCGEWSRIKAELKL